MELFVVLGTALVLYVAGLVWMNSLVHPEQRAGYYWTTDARNTIVWLGLAGIVVLAVAMMATAQ
jgi:hypothetical protein